MAKRIEDVVYDSALNYIKNNCTRLVLCSAEPTTYTEGNATYALADVTVSSTDFTVANGDTSGRKVTVAAKSGVTVDTSGTATHIALLDVSNTALLAASTTSSTAVAAAGTVDIGSFKFEIADPT